MDSNTQHAHRITFLTNTAYWIVIVALVFFILKYLVNLVMPLFLAVVFAALARPLARFLSVKEHTWKRRDGTVRTFRIRFPLNYNVAAVLSVVITFLLILALLTLIVTPFISFISGWFITLPELYNNVFLPEAEEILGSLDGLYSRLDPMLAGVIEDAIPNIISSLSSLVSNMAAKMLGFVSSLAGSLPSFLLDAIICLIATVFIAIDFGSISLFIQWNLKSTTLHVVQEIKDSLVDVLWQFFRSYFLIFLITAAEISLGLFFIGVGRPMLFGILIAIFDAFPIVGSGMILLPWSIIAMITAGFWRGFAMFLLYLFVVIVRQIIEPKIVGKRVGLRPVVTLSCMYVGTSLFGGIGLFALPIAASIIVDLNDSGVLHFFRRPEGSSSPEDSVPAQETAPDAAAQTAEQNAANAEQ